MLGKVEDEVECRLVSTVLPEKQSLQVVGLYVCIHCNFNVIYSQITSD